jgi:predicted  nucleic acid-binding Zn-ribbon protein
VEPILIHLLDLQKVDLRLLEVRARLAGYPKRVAEVDAHVAAARGEVEKSKAAQIATIKDRKRYELDVEQWKEKARKYKSQMYEVKTNEAYKALQHEAEMAEAEMASAEDRLLEQMVAGEEYDRRIKASVITLAEVEDAARGERSQIQAEQAAAQQELAGFEAERQKAVAQIPEDILDHYQRIAKRHGGVALAEVRGEICGMCGVRIRPHVFQELRSENGELYHCETCTRILYFFEPPPKEGVPAPAPATPPQAGANES